MTPCYTTTIEQSFYHTWDYLTICANNGIVINASKFQFCKDTITFAGLNITPEGITPSNNLLLAIKDFHIPKDITGARSWFGLVNQLSWAYSISNIMQPFRDLIKHNNKFYWDDVLTRLFHDSKALLIDAVKEGIRSFDINRPTCLQCDWSKDGLGYLLLQKYCKCALDNAPICCPDGWHLVYASFRFTNPAESRYSPTEGEALAVSWSLQHARLFTLGYNNLIVSTDHKPLLGIFNDRALGDITNPRIQSLKEKTLRYQFSIQHCPGKWHRGPDALSRKPVATTEAAIISCIRESASIQDSENTDQRESMMCSVNICALSTLNGTDPKNNLITMEDINHACKSDTTYSLLVTTIQNGFPITRQKTVPALREFWEVRNRLSATNNIALLDRRPVIPSSLRKNVLHTLHAAHQGVTGMSARANQSIYWPGMNSCIRNYRANCKTCSTNAPSQHKEPLELTPTPQWPFQQICADYFDIASHSYLSIVDRFSGWICIYYFRPGQATAKHLITILRDLFTAYGSPEELCSDGGPQFVATTIKEFLKAWGVHHRISSVAYPQSNGRAELGVKAARRIVLDNTLPDGSLDNDKAARAILQYRNTPLNDIHLSPAQILLHRQLRDHLPIHPEHYHLRPEWLASAQQRELLLAQRNHVIMQRYNPGLPRGRREF